MPARLDNMPEGLGTFLNRLYEASGYPKPEVSFCKVPFDCGETDPKKALVAFSSGKDCVAAVLKLQAQGYSCTLFHVRGTNRKWSELEYCIKLAHTLGCPLHVRQMDFEGRAQSRDLENPVHNHVILAQMVEWGAPQGFGTYAFGSASHIGDDINPCACLSDSVELFEDLEAFYRQWVPGFTLAHPVLNETDAYWTLFNARPDIFADRAYMSCMTPDYRKPRIHSSYVKRGIALEKSRCGMCEKCAYEYLHYVAFGVEKFNRWYFDKCVSELQIEVKYDTPFDKQLTREQVIRHYLNCIFLKDNVPGWQDFDMDNGDVGARLQKMGAV